MLNYNKRNSKLARRIITAVKGLTVSLLTLDVVTNDKKYSVIIMVTGFVCSELITLFSAEKQNED